MPWNEKIRSSDMSHMMEMGGVWSAPSEADWLKNCEIRPIRWEAASEAEFDSVNVTLELCQALSWQNQAAGYISVLGVPACTRPFVAGIAVRVCKVGTCFLACFCSLSTSATFG